MDSESGRCRRTDGKKWRCSKSVVPNEKYCETHMHRGSKRSRKLVETSTTGSTSSNSHTPDSTNTNRRNNPNNNSTINNPMILDHKPQFPPSKKPVNSNIDVKGEKYDGEFNDNVNKEIVVMNRSSGLGFSPDSVLHGDLRHPSGENYKLDLKTESERCRRTDGKKWRCNNRVVPHQKYCTTHMNRGAKKPITLQSTTRNDNTPSYALGYESEQTQLSLGLTTSSNTPYSSGSVATGIEDDSMAVSGETGSTTETTITDESIDITDIITVSP